MGKTGLVTPADWIPSFDGVKTKLKSGAKVTDAGCRFGASTIIMAKGYPRSTFIGFDHHKPSILIARKCTKEAGLTNVTYVVAKPIDFPVRDTTSLATSIICITWAILSALRSTSKRHSHRMVRG